MPALSCPNGDSLLQHRIISHDKLDLDYYLCPRCGGYWLSGFDANFLKSSDLKQIKPASKESVLRGYCPVCKKILEPAHTENIPPDVHVYRCVEGHGFFFPYGELKKFKQAQEAKLTYHKLWQIPLHSVAGSLLMSIIGLIVSGGLILGVIEGQRQQTIRSQASQIITSHKAYPAINAVTIIALTIEPVSLTVFVDSQPYPMTAPDQKSHVVRIKNLTMGAHRYYFSFQKAGKTLKTESFSFSLKDQRDEKDKKD